VRWRFWLNFCPCMTCKMCPCISCWTDVICYCFLVVGKRATAVAANVTYLTTGTGKSYMCNKATTFDLHNGLAMEVSDLQYQAFKSGNTTQFGGLYICFIQMWRYCEVCYFITIVIVRVVWYTVSCINVIVYQV
jgi:hypothetical protein